MMFTYHMCTEIVISTESRYRDQRLFTFIVVSQILDFSEDFLFYSHVAFVFRILNQHFYKS